MYNNFKFSVYIKHVHPSCNVI